MDYYAVIVYPLTSTQTKANAQAELVPVIQWLEPELTPLSPSGDGISIQSQRAIVDYGPRGIFGNDIRMEQAGKGQCLCFITRHHPCMRSVYVDQTHIGTAQMKEIGDYAMELSHERTRRRKEWRANRRDKQEAGNAS